MWEGPQAFRELADNPGKYHKVVFERTEA
jgi:hypothetical protein